MLKKNRFGTNGCYTCRVCKKKTRNTGDEGFNLLCRACWDAAGEDNAHSDGYHTEGCPDNCPQRPEGPVILTEEDVRKSRQAARRYRRANETSEEKAIRIQAQRARRARRAE